MPELPEVETTVRELRKKVLGRTFVAFWTDWKKLLRKPKSFEEFKKELLGKRIENVKRRGKLILIELSQGKTLLIHQKLTGHLLVGRWKFEGGKWIAPPGPLSEKINTYLHLMFTLDSGLMIGLSDLRKFAFLELWDSQELARSQRLKEIGPEPLDKNFTFKKFKEILQSAQGRIKQVLMNQKIIAGIGNIYSDEILWQAKVHPFKEVRKLNEKEIKMIYEAMKKILKKAIEFRGESISDYRTPSGKRGSFDKMRKVYRREGEKCSRCSTIIERIKIGGRSAHYCPKCQTL